MNKMTREVNVDYAPYGGFFFHRSWVEKNWSAGRFFFYIAMILSTQIESYVMVVRLN